MRGILLQNVLTNFDVAPFLICRISGWCSAGSKQPLRRLQQHL
jgi:hypothetical protein